MAYEKTEWKPRSGSDLNRYEKINETSRFVTLQNAPTAVTDPGTPHNTDNMNKIEEGDNLSGKTLNFDTSKHFGKATYLPDLLSYDKTTILAFGKSAKMAFTFWESFFVYSSIPISLRCS
jgi:hypothetical protein